MTHVSSTWEVEVGQEDTPALDGCTTDRENARRSARLSDLYVGEDFGRIDRYDLSTGLASPPRFAHPSFPVRGLVVDLAGDLFATDVTNNRIVEYTSAGVMGVFSTSPLLRNPHGLAFDSAGNLYVANAGNDTILKFTPKGVGSVFNTQSLGDLPVGLAFDSSGNLFVSDQATNKIVRITPSGLASNFATTGVLGPAGMAFDSVGNLFVSAESSFSIVKSRRTEFQHLRQCAGHFRRPGVRLGGQPLRLHPRPRTQRRPAVHAGRAAEHFCDDRRTRRSSWRSLTTSNLTSPRLPWPGTPRRAGWTSATRSAVPT